MTKFQKQMLTIAAAGALTAVTALPAMAFENEFHGLYIFNANFTNMGLSGDFNPGTYNATANTNWGDKRKMQNFLEQRVRIQYIAKASDDLKLVTHFEINNRFGNSNDVNGGGADLDTDGTNIVTKHAYLDFNVGKSFNTKLGLQPYKDTIKGIFIDADAPMVLTTSKLGNYTLGLGFSRFADDNANAGTGYLKDNNLGSATKNLFVMDNTFAFNKDTKAAFSYYLLADNAGSPASAFNALTSNTNNSAYILGTHTKDQSIMLHTLALSGETKVGGINLSGFAAMQAGNQKGMLNTGASAGHNRQFHGWAANVAANMKIGPGTAKTAFLFTSGNNSTDAGQYKGWVSTSVNSYNESGMMIVARNTYNSPTSADGYIRRDVQNIALLTAGYDAQLTDKFNLNTNVGFAWAPSSDTAPYDRTTNLAGAAAGAGRNGSDFMGTEINLEAGYQLYKNLKLQAQGGYMILGGYYKNSTLKTGFTAANVANVTDPENPYTMRLQARYSF
ncbi:hypothetical protein [Trichlorobacter lovleyi]|uniref:hypothetical protein n=1 Tax=Trichlorobacter lovleyi TaxID=313985 RepID=UPI0023EF5F94|nr:hypothetical protein [Trichlorobacter lovleyi]